MKITKTTKIRLEKIIRESINSMNTGKLVIDWMYNASSKTAIISDILFAVGRIQIDGVKVLRTSGPGGWPEVEIYGSRKSLEEFFVNVYMEGDPHAMEEFDMFFESL